jgi:hypothetical protein
MKRAGKIIIISFVFFAGLISALLLKEDFVGTLSEIVGNLTNPSTKIRAPRPVTADLSSEENNLLAFSNALINKIPNEILGRIKKMELIDISLSEDTKRALNKVLSFSDLSLADSGDLKLIVEAIEQDGSIYLMCAVEAIKTKNRIFEISDQMQKKTR